ncbi:hypothetical protein [Micromonospora tulbaghiae]
MGKLIVTEFLTLDGVAQAPGEPDEDREGGFSHGGWQMPLLDDRSGAVMFQQASGMDALLLAQGARGHPLHRPAQRRTQVRGQPHARRPAGLGELVAGVR